MQTNNTETMARREVLEQAIKTICHDRQDQYGEPENNLLIIASLWNTYLLAAGIIDPAEDAPVIKPKDVAAMMALLKLARIATGSSKADNWIDLAGYAGIGGEVESQEDANDERACEMTAVEYLEAHREMCAARMGDGGIPNCKGCPLDESTLPCGQLEEEDPRLAVEIVRKWREVKPNE